MCFTILHKQGALCSVLLTKYNSGDQIKKTEMGRTCGTYGGEERWGKLRVGVHLEDPGVDGRIILEWMLERLDGGIDWIDMVQDRDKWRALVNKEMNLRIQ
jgi:hypothetical protein